MKEKVSKIKVFGVIKNDFIPKFQEIYIEKEGVIINLNQKDCQEFLDTINGRKRLASSKLKDGQFQPEFNYVFNMEKKIK